MKQFFPDDSMEARRFNLAMAIARRHMWYRSLLWTRLKTIAPTQRRDQSDQWQTQYTGLLQRALKHEQRMTSHNALVFGWLTEPMRPAAKKALLRLVTVNGQMRL